MQIWRGLAVREYGRDAVSGKRVWEGEERFWSEIIDGFSVCCENERMRAVCLVLWPSLGGSRDKDKNSRNARSSLLLFISVGLTTKPQMCILVSCTLATKPWSSHAAFVIERFDSVGP